MALLPNQLERLERQAAMMGALRHENIVQVRFTRQLNWSLTGQLNSAEIDAAGGRRTTVAVHGPCSQSHGAPQLAPDTLPLLPTRRTPAGA